MNIISTSSWTMQLTSVTASDPVCNATFPSTPLPRVQTALWHRFEPLWRQHSVLYSSHRGAMLWGKCDKGYVELYLHSTYIFIPWCFIKHVEKFTSPYLTYIVGMLVITLR